MSEFRDGIRKRNQQKDKVQRYKVLELEWETNDFGSSRAEYGDFCFDIFQQGSKWVATVLLGGSPKYILRETETDTEQKAKNACIRLFWDFLDNNNLRLK